MSITSSIITSATEYLGYAPKQLDVDLAIELFSDCRNYPSLYTDERKEADMLKNKSKIVMAVIEIDAKDGTEGQTSHSENGINRAYGNSPIPKAYERVVQIAHVIYNTGGTL